MVSANKIEHQRAGRARPETCRVVLDAVSLWITFAVNAGTFLLLAVYTTRRGGRITSIGHETPRKRRIGRMSKVKKVVLYYYII